MGHGVNRREDNILHTPFHLRFVERVYDGSPRWWSDDWTKHTTRVAGKYGDRLDREPGVSPAKLVHTREVVDRRTQLQAQVL